MSDPINPPPVSGIDVDIGARLNDRARPEATAPQAWFASEMIALGAIALPSGPPGTGSQDLEQLVDGILAPIGG